ncbi:MAG: hypothetical protein IT423_21310 [Pirellulaceae bacterium]|nr:hypothetical protein [Pirellulaceae bacterium]
MPTTQANMPDMKNRRDEHDDHEEGQVEDFTTLVSEVCDSCDRYCRSRPGVVAGVLFGLGFFCGWKLRPW